MRLKSVEAQTFQDYEIIVADDSGTGAALAQRALRRTTRAFATARIRHRCGVALSLRAALAEARGKYIAILNDDDLWEPDFLARLVPAARSGPDTGFWRSAITRSWTRTAESTKQRPSATPNGSDDRAFPKATSQIRRRSCCGRTAFRWRWERCFERRRFRLSVSCRTWPGAYDFWISSLMAGFGRRLLLRAGAPDALSRACGDGNGAGAIPKRRDVSRSSRARCSRSPRSPISATYLNRWLASLTVAGGPRLPVFRSRR